MPISQRTVSWSWDQATAGKDVQMIAVQGNQIVGGPVKGEHRNGLIVSAEPMQIRAKTSSPTVLIFVDGVEYLRHETVLTLNPGDSLSLS